MKDTTSDIDALVRAPKAFWDAGDDLLARGFEQRGRELRGDRREWDIPTLEQLEEATARAEANGLEGFAFDYYEDGISIDRYLVKYAKHLVEYLRIRLFEDSRNVQERIGALFDDAAHPHGTSQRKTFHSQTVKPSHRWPRAA